MTGVYTREKVALLEQINLCEDTGHADTRIRWSHDDGGREWSYAFTSQGMHGITRSWKM